MHRRHVQLRRFLNYVRRVYIGEGKKKKFKMKSIYTCILGASLQFVCNIYILIIINILALHNIKIYTYLDVFFITFLPVPYFIVDYRPARYPVDLWTVYDRNMDDRYAHVKHKKYVPSTTPSVLDNYVRSR